MNQHPLRVPAIATLAFVLGMPVVQPCAAESRQADSGFDCAACAVLTPVELESRRGGFEFAGLKFDFGANIRSFIDNRLVLESIVSITSEGVSHQQITPLPAAPAPPVEMQTRSMAEPEVSPPPVQSRAADSPAVITSRADAARVPATIDLSGLGNATGVTVNDRKGFTAALHEATRERIIGTLINTASGRDLRQELEVRIDVQGYRAFQQNARETLLNSRFGQSVLR